MNCFRYLNMRSFGEVDRMTLAEYRLLMKATKLRQIDMDYRNHLQAFLNFAVQAEKKSGKNKSKPVYSRFRKFYDYEKEINKVLKEEEKQSRFAGIGKFLKKGG